MSPGSGLCIHDIQIIKYGGMWYVYILVGFASSKCMLDQNISMHWDLDFPDALCIFCGCAAFWLKNESR